MVHKVCQHSRASKFLRFRRTLEEIIHELNKMQTKVFTTRSRVCPATMTGSKNSSPKSTATTDGCINHNNLDSNSSSKSIPWKWLRPVSSEAAVSPADLECSLCFRLLYQPVTTLCGHTFCRTCLERCLDHAPFCPLCKTSLARKFAVCQFLETALVQLVPNEHTERQKQHLVELAVADADTNAATADTPEQEIPIFVCTMAFPTISCPLHVFEPRYRLMVRRCVESGKRKFGMCCYLQQGDNNYADVGTLLKIKNVQYFSDGRSILDAVGLSRFRIRRKGVKDGYNTAHVEFIHDKPIPNADVSRKY